MFADDSFFVGLVFQSFESVGFALHRQYPAGLFAEFIHAQYEKTGFRFRGDIGIGGRLEYRTSSFDVTGLTLTAGNDSPQPYRTLIPLMDGVREILSADRNKE